MLARISHIQFYEFSFVIHDKKEFQVIFFPLIFILLIFHNLLWRQDQALKVKNKINT